MTGLAVTRPVRRNIAGERVQGASRQPCGSVRMPTGAATVDQTGGPVDLFDQTGIHRSVGNLVEQTGQPRQAGDARPALSSVLRRQIGNDLGGAGQAAFVDTEDVDHSGSGGGPEPCQRLARQIGPGDLR